MIVQADYMLSEAEFQLVRRVVYEHCGIALSDEKIAMVRARIAKQMRVGGFTSVKSYLDQVVKDRNGRAFAGFIDAISTNLTSFFRENQHFEYLSNTLLPALLAEKRRAGNGQLLAWSAACSSGEEPYTLAMTLLDAASRIDAGLARWDLRLLATDISTAMLTTARAGVYSASRLATVPERHRTRFFKPAGAARNEQMFEVSPELRKVVRFRHLNLMDAWPFKGPFDFVFCRNVMIYFDKGTQQELVDRMWNCLRPGGFLFTGHSESLTGIAHRFLHRQASVYEKSDL